MLRHETQKSKRDPDVKKSLFESPHMDIAQSASYPNRSFTKSSFKPTKRGEKLKKFDKTEAENPKPPLQNPIEMDRTPDPFCEQIKSSRDTNAERRQRKWEKRAMARDPVITSDWMRGRGDKWREASTGFLRSHMDHHAASSSIPCPPSSRVWAASSFQKREMERGGVEEKGASFFSSSLFLAFCYSKIQSQRCFGKEAETLYYTSTRVTSRPHRSF